METLKDIGELAAIERLCGRIKRHAGVATGCGDDCAVLRLPESAGHDLLLTSDPVIEGTHFMSGIPGAAIGRKAAGRVLSDIAALGGTPLWIMLDVAARPETPVTILEQIYEGATELADRHGVSIVGGDLSKGPGLQIHAFACGTVPADTAVLRSGAVPGDVICVTGSLGGSIAGKHLDFTPRVAEGQWLRSGTWASALTDVSDSFARDLRHIMRAGNLGAEIDTSRLPVSDDAAGMSDGMTPVEHALYDGEDYELLFTVPASRYEKFAKEWSGTFALPCAAVGIMTDRPGLLNLADDRGRRLELKDGDYEHFGK